MNKKSRTRKSTSQVSLALAIGLGLVLLTLMPPFSSAAIVINDPGVGGSTTSTTDRFYQVFTPSSSAHNLTELTITSFLVFDGSFVPSNYTYSVTFFADNGGARGAAITSAITFSSVTGLLSAAPLPTPPFYRFDVTFDLTPSPVYIGAGEAFWYELYSSVPDQNIAIKASTSNYGNDWGTGAAFAGASSLGNNTPGIILSAEPAGGPGPEPIPEPGTWAAAALLAGGAAFMRWRRRRDEAQKEAA
jgi:MYXO-CTERM domain-containing protein